MMAMDARDLFREQLRTTIGPALREEGFAGSGSNWRRRNFYGDWACINFQKSAWGSADSVSAYINLSINPLSKHLFDAWLAGRPPAKQPSTAGGLWFSRLDPPNGARQFSAQPWDFGDGVSRDGVIGAMVDALRSEAIPILNSLLDRTLLLSLLADPASGQVKGGHLQTWSRPAMRALLLSDDGPSPELDNLLESLEEEAAVETNEDWAGRLNRAVAWIRQRVIAA
jgi:Domain of unknown function (DUF4304)